MGKLEHGSRRMTKVELDKHALALRRDDSLPFTEEEPGMVSALPRVRRLTGREIVTSMVADSSLRESADRRTAQSPLAQQHDLEADLMRHAATERRVRGALRELFMKPLT